MVTAHQNREIIGSSQTTGGTIRVISEGGCDNKCNECVGGGGWGGGGVSQPVEALDGSRGGTLAAGAGAVVREHGASNEVGIPVDTSNADAVVSCATDNACCVGTVSLGWAGDRALVAAPVSVHEVLA